MQIPNRDPSCDVGSVVCAGLPQSLNQQREDDLTAQYTDGNVPDWIRTTCGVTNADAGHTLVFNVFSDYLCVGQGIDFVRTPLMPTTAQRIADLYGCMLPTTKMVDLIWKASSIKLVPQPMPPNLPGANDMKGTAYFVEHNKRINMQLSPGALGDLIAGHKKDVVISVQTQPGHVAIYGWQQPPSGTPIQGLNPTSHSNTYADYSHGIRLIDRSAILDGNPVDLFDVLADPNLCYLVSKEGVVSSPKYPY